VGDGCQVLLQAESLDGLLREIDGMGLEALHAGTGPDKLSRSEKAFSVSGCLKVIARR
jgi:hypothetical protein